MNYEKYIKLLKSYISPRFADGILGETDSECLFFMFLSCKKYLENKNTNTRKKTTNRADFTRSQHKMYETIIKDMHLQPNNEAYSVYFNAFSLLVHIFKTNHIEILANIVYANDEIVMMSRYIYHENTASKVSQTSCPLYWNKCSAKSVTGILITTEPFVKYKSTLIPENTIILVDYKQSELVLHKI